MATSTSNSNNNGEIIRRPCLGGFALLFGLIDQLENGEYEPSFHGWAETITSSYLGGTAYEGETINSSYSRVGAHEEETINDTASVAASQVTISLGGWERSESGSWSKGTAVGKKHSVVKTSGLSPDQEGKETRKAMLERRRKECSVEEVDVALAPVMKVPVPYVFYPEQYKLFRKLFPRVNVDSGLAYTHHDHPVAHTATLIGIRKMQQMIKSGEKVLDLHGNPNMNDNYNRFAERKYSRRAGLGIAPRIHTLVELKVAADAVRKVTKWGPERDVEGNRRWKEYPIEEVKSGFYDVFLSVHTLYYYKPRQVCELLSKNAGARMYALVNYEKHTSGKLYGELSYSKKDGITTQTSPNGETYKHNDIDYWFQTNSYRSPSSTLASGISWTSSSLGGPLYLITITSCPYHLADCDRYEPPEHATLQVVAGKNLGVVNVGGVDVKLNVSNFKLAAELRHFMTMRDRADPQVFSDLCVKARRITSPDLVDGSRKHEVDDGHLGDHIAYAYLVDAPAELDLLNGIRLLKAGLLDNHSASLKFSGTGGEITFVRAMLTWLVGRKEVDQALKHRTKDRAVGLLRNRSGVANTGGLLPFART